MNDRKQHVLMKAHQLFVEKGFQSTSIQDILDYSGISKGTFYNYFSSKNELLMAIFKELHKKLEKERTELLIGKDPADREVFMKQIELQVMQNRQNNLVSLYEEVLFLNDMELKEFIKQVQLRMLRWVYDRFVDLFGLEKREYLLDGAIMFTSILHHNLRYHTMAFGLKANPTEVIRYSVHRAVSLIDEVSKTGEQLLSPELIESWAPTCANREKHFSEKLRHQIVKIKKELKAAELEPYIELLDFIQDELLLSKNAPRRILIESALQTLEYHVGTEQILPLVELIKTEA